MIIYRNSYIPSDLEEKIIKDSNKAFNSITAYTLVNGIVDNYFYKKIIMTKVKERYSGNYEKLLIEYYERLKKYINCNELIGLIKVQNDLYEISKIIESDKILDNNQDVSFEKIKNLFRISLEGILKLENSNEQDLGIDSSIWNYSIDGTFFDYDPPKILSEETLFITKNNPDYKRRVLYRNFNYIGMRINTLGTIILGHNEWNFNITNLPNDYVEQLLIILFESIDKKNIKEKIKNDIYGLDFLSDFEKHPIDIIRKELKK